MLYEHMHRYAACRDYVAGLEVLDAGCGEGYGTAILGAVAARVTGIDIDAATIHAAQAKYGIKGRVLFREGDSRRTQLPEASFDAVVALETIEHIEDPERLVLEARRLLRPGGLFIVSTPNRDIYNRYKSPNPFHIKEMDQGEFTSLLERHFAHVDLLGQRMAIVSTMSPVQAPVESNNGSYRGFTASEAPGGAPTLETRTVRLDEPEYFLAVCSAEPIAHPAEASSIFLSRSDDLWAEHERIFAWASGLHEEDEALRRDLRELAEREAAANAALADRDQALTAARADVARLQDLADTFARQAEIHSRSLEAMNATNAALRQRLEDVEPAQELGRQGRQMLGSLIGRASGRQVADDPISLFDSLAGLLLDNAVASADRDRARREAEDQQKARTAAEAALADRLAAHEADQSARAAEIESLRNELAATQTALADLSDAARRSVEDHTREIGQLGAALEERNRAEVLVSRALDASIAERDRIQQTIAAINDEARANALRLMAEAQAQAEELDAVREEAAGANARLRALTDALVDAEQTAEALRAEAENAGGLKKLATELADRVTDLERQLAAKNAETSERLSVASAAESDALAARADRLKLIASRALREATAAARKAAQHADEAEREREAAVAGLAEALPFSSGGPRTPPPGKSRMSRLMARVRRIPTTSRLIQQGDVANRQRDWPAAEAFYAAALRHDPSLAPIWVQYGHALKEQGRRAPAEMAYRRAIALEGDNADTHIQLGHLLKVGGRLDAARAAYTRALELEPGNADAKRELKSLPPGTGPQGERELAAIADELTKVVAGGAEVPRAPAATPAPYTGPWPPKPIRDYWLPQRMRDYLADNYQDGVAELCRYLFSAVEAYGEDGAAFEASPACAALIARASVLSAAAQSGRPQISIIIPVYNNLVFTLTSIVSVLELAGERTFEIIVGDDGSSDSTPRAVRAIGGSVRLVRHDRNLGFLHNCNESARIARGTYLVFLNNDTIVLPGWLDRLIAPFAQFPDAGMVGSKLLNGDGTLQEAGGIFWRDGSAWNYGRGGDASLPEFNYLRRVDYCSGASIAIPTVLWRQLQGFDPAFTPAYCEDSDLAFRVRVAGYEVYYQPQSELVHHEGRSHGRDVASGIKAYQVTNQKKLFDRWRDVLERENFENGTDLLLARDRSRTRPHIVVIDHYVPQWDRDAGSRTMFDYLKLLASSGFQVTFWPDNLNYDREYARVLQGLGIEVIYSSLYVGKFAEWIDERAPYIDFVLFSRPHITDNYIDAVMKHRHIYRLYYGHDLHYRRMEDQRAIDPDSVSTDDIALMRSLEESVWRRCDQVMYPSETEAEIVRQALGDSARARAIPMLAIDASILAPRRDKLAAQFTARKLTELLFVGGFGHPPNVDAVTWFASNVMPLLRNSGHAYRLSIAGSNAPPAIIDLAGGDITYLGRVTDAELEKLYASAGFSVVPLRFGGGVKGKVIEAMANGVPLVMTSVGAQGIPAAGDIAIVEDDAHAMANAIIRGTEAPHELFGRVDRALQFIASNYSREAAGTAIGLNDLMTRFRDHRRP